MKSSKLLLLAVAVGFAVLGGCYYQSRSLWVDATYEEIGSSETTLVPTGARMTIQCIDDQHNVTSKTTMISERDNGEGRFYFMAIGITSGICTVLNMNIIGDYETREVYECDSTATENCQFDLGFYAGDYYVGEIHYTYLCRMINDCEQWCEDQEDCPSEECDECISECEDDKC